MSRGFQNFFRAALSFLQNVNEDECQEGNAKPHNAFCSQLFTEEKRRHKGREDQRAALAEGVQMG